MVEKPSPFYLTPIVKSHIHSTWNDHTFHKPHKHETTRGHAVDVFKHFKFNWKHFIQAILAQGHVKKPKQAVDCIIVCLDRVFSRLNIDLLESYFKSSSSKSNFSVIFEIKLVDGFDTIVYPSVKKNVTHVVWEIPLSEFTVGAHPTRYFEQLLENMPSSKPVPAVEDEPMVTPTSTASTSCESLTIFPGDTPAQASETEAKTSVVAEENSEPAGIQFIKVQLNPTTIVVSSFEQDCLLALDKYLDLGFMGWDEGAPTDSFLQTEVVREPWSTEEKWVCYTVGMPFFHSNVNIATDKNSTRRGAIDSLLIKIRTFIEYNLEFELEEHLSTGTYMYRREQ